MTSKTEFSSAIHILLSLLAAHSASGGEWLNSNDLAKSVGSHPVIIRRLVSKLVKAGLVESRTGRDGGVRLSRDPKKITAFDVMKAVDGGAFLKVHDSPKVRDCPVSCQIAVVMESIKVAAEAAAHSALKKLTLQKLYSRLK